MLEINLVACHAYRSNDPKHLSFPEGACISAKLGQEGNPLWLGSYKSRQGWFPPSYCRIQPWSSPHRIASRTRSLDDCDFAQVNYLRRPNRIDLRSKSMEENRRKRDGPPPSQSSLPEIFASTSIPVKVVTVQQRDHHGAKARLRASGIFAKVDRYVEELDQSSELTEQSPPPTTKAASSYRNTAIRENLGHHEDPLRVSPAHRSLKSRRRSKSTGGSWLQGLKDIRNLTSPRKTKKALPTPGDGPIKKMQVVPREESITPVKKLVESRPSRRKTVEPEYPVDPIEVLAAEFRARQALTPL